MAVQRTQLYMCSGTEHLCVEGRRLPAVLVVKDTRDGVPDAAGSVLDGMPDGRGDGVGQQRRQDPNQPSCDG